MWKRETRKSISLFSEEKLFSAWKEGTTCMIDTLHGLFNSSIYSSSNKYWWELTKVSFCIWSSVIWDLGVGLARRGLTENRGYTKFPCWRFFQLRWLVLKGRASCYPEENYCPENQEYEQLWLWRRLGHRSQEKVASGLKECCGLEPPWGPEIVSPHPGFLRSWAFWRSLGPGLQVLAAKP